MRPDGVEILRGLQGALAGVIAPEVQSLFALDSLQTAQMLLELLASEWDTAAETQIRDNETLSAILGRAEVVLRDREKTDLVALADEMAAALREPARPSLAVSALSARSSGLRSLLERVLVACEEAVGDGDAEALMALRAEIYRHLREVALRGWSVWDALSFRERMARARAETAGGQQM